MTTPMNEARFNEAMTKVINRLDRKIVRMKFWTLILGIMTVILYIWINK